MITKFHQPPHELIAGLVQASGILLGCTASLGAAIWLGLMFEQDLDPGPTSNHVIAVCFAMVAIAPLGWWFLLWLGAFRGKGWARTVGCLLPFAPPLAWALPLLASIPGILIYRLGESLYQVPKQRTHRLPALVMAR